MTKHSLKFTGSAISTYQAKSTFKASFISCAFLEDLISLNNFRSPVNSEHFDIKQHGRCFINIFTSELHINELPATLHPMSVLFCRSKRHV